MIYPERSSTILLIFSMLPCVSGRLAQRVYSHSNGGSIIVMTTGGNLCTRMISREEKINKIQSNQLPIPTYPTQPKMSPSPSPPPSTAPAIHTYHCLCSTLLLATPYQLPSLPTRAPPSRDLARILPLPPFLPPPPLPHHQHDPPPPQQQTQQQQLYLPSLLLPTLRPGRKITLVQREDGYERRRVWRCGRCGCAVGYEVEHDSHGSGGADGEEGGMMGVRVMFILEEGLVRTEDMLGEGGKG